VPAPVLDRAFVDGLAVFTTALSAQWPHMALQLVVFGFKINRHRAASWPRPEVSLILSQAVTASRASHTA